MKKAVSTITFASLIALHAHAQPLANNETDGPMRAAPSEYSEAPVPCTPAETGAYLATCNRFTTEQGTTRCIEIGRGRYFDQCALALCNRFVTEGGILQALTASRDKRYLDSEMALCNRYSTESGAVSCLNAAGNEIQNPNQEYVTRELQDAVSLLQSQHYQQAEVKLQELLRYIREH